MLFRRLLAIAAMALMLITPALAADWVVLRLRGDVQVMVEGGWVALKRGDVVANEQMVRTLANGHAELQRDKELVTLGSNTEIRIQQDAESGYTTVLQDFGRVEVDAEAKRVKHFEVRTPYLAAVVKGTHFVVTSDDSGATVAVDRGSVAVQSIATERTTLITVGQTATVARRADLTVGGLGPWPAIVEPGVSRPTIVSSLGGALGTAPTLDAPQGGSTASAPTVTSGTSFAPSTGSSGSGGVSVITASATSSLFGGFAVAPSSSTAQAEPAQPVSLGVVLIGALCGALLGALALLFRRGF